MAHGPFVNLFGVVTDSPLEHGAAVGNFAGKNRLRHLSRGVKIISPSVLLTPEEHVSRDRPLDPREKTPMLAEEAQAHFILGAEPHQEWTASNVAETDNAADGMDGHAEAHVAINLNRYRLAFL
jgi:hypothetical protein